MEDKDKNLGEAGRGHRAVPSAETKPSPELSAGRWSNYRMWHRPVNAVANGGCSAEWLGEWKPTSTIFRARSQPEAQKKAEKFWREAQYGGGSMLCVPADEDLRLTMATKPDTSAGRGDSERTEHSQAS